MGKALLMLKQKIEPYKNFAQAYYIDRDSAHDFRHIERIISRLNFLSQEVSQLPNKALLYFLACFHGLQKNIHNDTSFRDRVTDFLQDLGWTKTEIEMAFDSLERHTDNPQTVEEKIVHDANYVELLGAFGIFISFYYWRCLSTNL